MSARLTRLLHRLRFDQRGLTTVEYVIVLCLIAAVAVGTWQKFGHNVYSALKDANTKISTQLGK